MIIANPIYDVVFKYLLEDMEITRELLSAILSVPIKSLVVKPQETLVKGEAGDIKIFHLDFYAKILTEEGTEKSVLIELQKAKQSYDILRFRKYLGETYKKEEWRKDAEGKPESYSIEIVTIYILGFKLDDVPVPVAKVSRVVEDAITKEIIKTNSDFLKQLTHECFTIQIPRLQNGQRSQLEEIIEIFNQDYVTDDLHKIEFKIPSQNALVKKMLRRLARAAGDEKIQRIMEAEDSIERMLSRELKEKTKKYEEEIAEKDNMLTEKDNIITEKDNMLTEKDNVITEKENMLTEKDNVITEKDNMLSEKDNVIAALIKQMEEMKNKS